MIARLARRWIYQLRSDNKLLPLRFPATHAELHGVARDSPARAPALCCPARVAATCLRGGASAAWSPNVGAAVRTSGCVLRVDEAACLHRDRPTLHRGFSESYGDGPCSKARLRDGFACIEGGIKGSHDLNHLSSCCGGSEEIKIFWFAVNIRCSWC
jgi:hypothetical protein